MIKRFANAWDLQCNIYFLSSSGKWSVQKKSGKRLIKTNYVVCKWCLPVGAVCGCRRWPASKYISPDPAVSARALTRGEQLHVSILTETEDFSVCTLCQSPKALLLRSLVPCTASQTSNINASIASQPVLLPRITIDSSFCWEAPVCLLPPRDWCRLQSRAGTFCRRRLASAWAQPRRIRRREKLSLAQTGYVSFIYAWDLLIANTGKDS